MKILSKDEVKVFAETLVFTEEEAQDIVDIFARIYTEEQGGLPGWKICQTLDSVEEYIREYEGHWHREPSIEEHLREEKLNYYNDYEDKSVFDSVEKFREFTKNLVYKLAHSDMVIVTC